MTLLLVARHLIAASMSNSVLVLFSLLSLLQLCDLTIYVFSDLASLSTSHFLRLFKSTVVCNSEVLRSAQYDTELVISGESVGSALLRSQIEFR